MQPWTTTRIMRRLLASTCLAGLIASPSTAFAQSEDRLAIPSQIPEPDLEGQAQAAEVADKGMITVTGSRIKRTGYDQQTPVTVVSTEALLTASPTNIADGLNRLPQFQGSRTRVFCCEVVSVGNYLNLRALGPQRTLVLLDNQRVAPTRESGDVDVNMLPELLIDRIDIVTGGASAAYGSDAVSGVVNYIIDNKFTGFKFLAQSGINGYGDNHNLKLAGAWGAKFADDRGHVVLSLEHFKSDGIDSLYDIPLSAREAFLGGNGSAATPFTAVVGSRQNTGSYGGVFVNAAGVPVANAAAPLAGINFNPDGSTSIFNTGTPIPGSGPNFSIGGSGFTNNLATPVQSLRTDRAYFKLSYELTPSITPYLRVVAGESQNQGDVLANSAAGAAVVTIFNDNAFLPAAVVAAMAGSGQTSARFARFNRDFGAISLNYINRMFDVNVGVDGEFGDGWSWHAHYSRGESKLKGRTENATVLQNLYAAADAVRDSNGQIVCRVTITNPGVFPGCVPINLFGEGSPSQAAKDYVLDTSTQTIRNTQDIMAAEIQGKLIDLPGGPLAIAVGAEYRKRGLLATSNPIALGQIQSTGVRGFPTAFCPTATTCRFGGFNQGNYGVADASDTVKELFGEINAPLLKDLPFAHSLEVNAALRHTNYTNSGGVNTYKIGVTWEPIQDLRFRAAHSQDIRAPNLFELFAGPVNAFQAGLSDLRTMTTNVIGITRTQGNPDLLPERAKTTTLGVVFTPGWLPGFAGSVDFYDINIKGALSATTAQATLDQCFGGDTEACSRVTRDSTGVIQQIRLLQINLNSRKARGIDFDLSYDRPLAGGRLGLRAVFNHAIDFLDTVGGKTTQRAGGFANLLAIPDWRGNLSASYERDNFGINVQERYIGGYDLLPFGPGLLFADSRIGAIWYTDVTLTAKIGSKLGDFELFGTVNNLFNNQPPFFPNRFAAALAVPTTAHSLYDLDNRYFTVGIKGRF